MSAAKNTSKTIDAEVTNVSEETIKEIDNPAPARDLVVPAVTRDELNNVASFAEAMSLVEDAYGGFEDASEFSAVDKSELLGKPFLIMSWEVRDSEDFIGEQFVVCYCITPDNDKFVFTDGGAGILARLEQINQRSLKKTGKEKKSVMCRRGLRVSEFGLNDDREIVKLGAPDQTSKGKTYYVN